MKKFLKEGLAFGDLKGLVSNTVIIDKYSPKIGTPDETVVVAFIVFYEDPANALSNFIETGFAEIIDVEVSPGPTDDGNYIVFAEFQRKHSLFRDIQAMLTDVDQITSKSLKWEFEAFRYNGSIEFNEDNFNDRIINNKYDYRDKAKAATK
jgi:hypothetical protein